MLFDLKDKTVVIIGGCGLLGEACVRVVLGQNASVVIGDLEEKKGRELSSRLEKDNERRISFIKCDITDEASVASLLGSAVKEHGKVDAVVNCSYPKGKNYGRKFENVDFQGFCNNVNLHLGGYFVVSRVFAEYFKERGGNLINFSSIYGVAAPKFEIYEGTEMTMPVEYAAIKAGIIALTRYIASYYRGHNVRANCVSPGGIINGQSPAFMDKYKEQCLNQGMLVPEDVTGAVLFLLSEASKPINGQNIVVDDGFTL